MDTEILPLFLKSDYFGELFKQVCWQGHCTQMEVIIVKQNSVATHLLDLVRRGLSRTLLTAFFLMW